MRISGSSSSGSARTSWTPTTPARLLPSHSPKPLRLHERSPYVNVSDGGHLENLGTFELLRRRCSFIIVIDGEADPEMRFTSFVKLIRLARIFSEALVLFEWLVRFNQIEGTPFEDPAEERVLFDLEARLERMLTEPLASDYRQLVEHARARVRDRS